MIADAALTGPENAVVQDAIAAKHPHRTVVHLDRKADVYGALRRFKEVDKPALEALEVRAGAPEMLGLRLERIDDLTSVRAR